MKRSLSNVVRRIALAGSLLTGLWFPVSASAEKFITYWHLAEHQLNIKEGGRANTIAVHENGTEMFVASETGGLFKSVDGVHRWEHVDTLPVYFTQSVAYFPMHPEILFVTAKADFKTKNGGGVWRSGDGGETWTQAELNVPGFTGRLSAYEISIGGEFGPVAVGTSQGVFLSYDRGLSWTYWDVFAGGNKTVYSVLAVSEGTRRIYAAGPSGMRVATANPFPGTWAPPINDPTNGAGIHDIHAFGRSPLSTVSSPKAFLVTRTGELFHTQDGGGFWRWIPEAPPGGPGCGGTTFVKAVRRSSGVNTFLDMYVGNRCGLHLLTARTIDNTADFNHVIKQTATVDRAGTRDIAVFRQDAVLLGTNAGLHYPSDRGLTWTITGGGRDGGYNALQVTEVDGQMIAGLGTNLYVATQDNSLWATTIFATTNGSHPGSAFYVEGERRVAEGADSRFTFVPGNQPPKLAGPQLAVLEAWNNPPGEAGKPAYIRRRQWVQQVRATASLQQGLALTDNASIAWRQFAAFSQEPRDIPKAGRPGDTDTVRNSIVYQPFRTSRLTSGRSRPTFLMRIHHQPFSQNSGTVFFPSMSGFGGLGINPTMFAWYQVYGIDPGNPFHVIAPDVVNQRMMRTENGGETWTEIPELTALVKDDGNLLFRTDLSGRNLGEVFPIVTAVSFCPDDPNLVLIGTSEGGILRSNDRGLTWSKLENTTQATYITSFFWQTANTVFVSTYGRGLWMLRNVRIAVQDSFNDVCPNCEVFANDSGAAAPRFDGSVTVFEGSVLGVRTEKGLLREVFVTPGSSVVFTGDQKDPQEDITITESDGKDTSSYDPLPKPPDGWIVAGAVFTSDDTLTGTVFAPSEISLVPPMPKEEYGGSTESPTKGMPYIRLTAAASNGVPAAAPHEMLDLAATDFVAGARYEVLLDGEPVKGEVTADGGGSFDTRIAAPPELGYHAVEVRMVGDKEPIDGSVFVVRPQD